MCVFPRDIQIGTGIDRINVVEDIQKKSLQCQDDLMAAVYNFHFKYRKKKDLCDFNNALAILLKFSSHNPFLIKFVCVSFS